MYYSSTTLYYKVLLRYYSVLQSTTPVLQSTTPVLQSTTLILLCTTKYYSNTTPALQSISLYYKVLLRCFFETSFTMRGASKVTLETQEVLRPRKTNLIIDPRDMQHHFQCAEQVTFQLTKYCACYEIFKLKISRFQRKFREVLPPIERRFEDNPSMIRR